MAPEFSAESKRECQRILARYPDRQGALLPILHLAQQEWGCISDEVVERISELLQLPPSRVRGVVTFYPAFRTRPVGSHLIEVCSTLSCSLMGSEEVVDYLREKLSIEIGETTSDARFTLQRTECLAACGTAPVMMVDGELYESLTRQRIDQILDRLS